MAVTGTPRMVTDGLVLYFDAANVKSYVSGSTTWTDLSPSISSGSLTNGPTFSSDVNGSIRFDGTNDYIPTNFFGTYQQITVSAWAKGMSKPSTAVHIIGKNYFFATTTNSWPCVLEATETTCGFRVSNGSAYSITQGVNGAEISASISSGWNHLTGTYDGSFARIYINGILVVSQSYSGIVNYSGSLNLPWTIGRPAGYNGGGTGLYYATGSIAIAQIYDRALSANEVFQNYEATRERFGV